MKWPILSHPDPTHSLWHSAVPESSPLWSDQIWLDWFIYIKTFMSISSQYWKLSFVLEICRVIILYNLSCLSRFFRLRMSYIEPTDWLVSTLHIPEFFIVIWTYLQSCEFCRSNIFLYGAWTKRSSEGWWHKFGQRFSAVTLQIGQKFTNTVEPKFHVPAVCIFCKLTYFLYGPC